MTAIARVGAAGVTVITYGHGADTDGWVRSMAEAIKSYSEEVVGEQGQGFHCDTLALSCHRVSATVTDSGMVALSQRPLAFSGAAASPLEAGSGEIIIILDWSELANFSHSTKALAEATASTFLAPGVLEGFAGHRLAELPIHLIGHSRGTSVMAETRRTQSPIKPGR